MHISVIIPLYNKAKTIERAMNSVIQQLDNCSELIVVDDGSSDASLAVARSVGQQHFGLNIKIHTQKNGGVSAARNTGTQLAQGQFVAFLDADDSFDACFLPEIKSLIDAFPAAMVYATAYRFRNAQSGTEKAAEIAGLQKSLDQQLLRDYFYSASKGDLPITSSSVCINKAVLVALGGFPEKENMGEDQAVWSQLALHHSIAISNKICATYNTEYCGSLMQSVAPENEMPFCQRLQNQLDLEQVPTKFKVTLKLYIAGHIFDLVRRNLNCGNRTNARRLLADRRTRTEVKRWWYWQFRIALQVIGV